MAEISKPTELSKTWARLGTKIEPDDAKKDSGYGKEIPVAEEHNFLWNRSDTAVAHINQHGIPEWDITTEYIANKSLVMGSNGYIYRCKVTNTANNPVSDSTFTNWGIASIPERKNLPLATLTTQNSWTNGTEQPRVRVVDDILYLTGRPSGGTTTIFTTITTLPVAYRPSTTRYFTTMLDDTGASGWRMIPMQILSTGEIQPLLALPNNTGFYLIGSVPL